MIKMPWKKDNSIVLQVHFLSVAVLVQHLNTLIKSCQLNFILLTVLTYTFLSMYTSVSFHIVLYLNLCIYTRFS